MICLCCFCINYVSIVGVPGQVTSIKDSVSVSLWWDSNDLLDKIDGMSRYFLSVYFIIANMFALDMYDIPLPFESLWSAEMTRRAVFLFATMLVDSLEAALQARCFGFAESTDKWIDTRIIGNHSMFEMMKKRYLEDYLVTNCSATSSRNKLGTLELDVVLERKFSERALMFTSGFMKLHDTILPSDGDSMHRLWAVRTKALDYIEELFFNFAAAPVSQDMPQEDGKVPCLEKATKEYKRSLDKFYYFFRMIQCEI